MATLQWRDVNVSVDISKGIGRGSTTKPIIFNSSGIIQPGQILAVVGPSGAGKTTLFNVLAKRNQNYDVTGSLMLNGRSYDSDLLKMMSGFVWQDALYHSHLTPREALTFAARLKLASSVTREQRTERINNLLRVFDLERCADTRIGNDTIKGISGGEKKRLSIAVEVLANPDLLFLDEPTSGLDATSAYRIVSLLHLLAGAGTTIVMTVHQPRPAIARSIDRFLVLSAGHQVFFGPMEQMMTHFGQLGFTCPAGENPLDYMLDLINNELDEHGGAMDVAKMLQVVPRSDSEFKLDPLPSAMKPGQTRTELALELSHQFRSSPLARDLLFTPSFLNSKAKKGDVNKLVVTRGGFRSTWLTRVGVVMHREFLQKLRNPQVALTQWMGALIMGTIMGTFYYQVPVTSYTLICNALAFVFMFSVFFSFHLVLFFPKERHIFIRDFTQGLLGSSEYYVGLVLTDMPFTLLSAATFSTVFYFMVGLRASQFGVFLGIVLLASVTGGAMLMTMGAFAPDPATANSLVSMCFLFCMFLNGYFAQSPPAWTWIETINYLRFVTMAAFENQWAGLPINCTSVPGCQVSSGDEVLALLKVPRHPIGMWCLYTIIVFCIFHVVGSTAVSFLYNGRPRNWWQRYKERHRQAKTDNTPPTLEEGLSEQKFDEFVVNLH